MIYFLWLKLGFPFLYLGFLQSSLTMRVRWRNISLVEEKARRGTWRQIRRLSLNSQPSSVLNSRWNNYANNWFWAKEPTETTNTAGMFLGVTRWFDSLSFGVYLEYPIRSSLRLHSYTNLKDSWWYNIVLGAVPLILPCLDVPLLLPILSYENPCQPSSQKYETPFRTISSSLKAVSVGICSPT